MKDMDKGMYSSESLISQNELAFHNLEKKKRRILLTISNDGIKEPKLMFIDETHKII